MSLDEFSFDTLLLDDNDGDDRVVSFTSSPSTAIGDSHFPYFPSPEMEVVALNREETQNFTRTYLTIYGWDPTGVKV